MTLEFFRNTAYYRREFNTWQERHNRDAPKKGELAPDIELKDVSGEHIVRLSQYQGKMPVALVFGSFT